MSSYQQQLENLLESNGWTIQSVDGDHNDWWADEFWHLESVWSPLGYRCYLTFIVDPQHDGPRKPRQALMAVGLSKTRPTDWSEAGFYHYVYLDKNFAIESKGLVEQLNKLRKR